VLVALPAACATGGSSASGPTPAEASGSTPSRAAEPVTTEIALATFDTTWNRIARLHYDSTFNGVDWDAVRAALRPQAQTAGTQAVLRELVTDMLERLGESHYGLIPAEVADAMDPATDRTARGGADDGDLGLELRKVEQQVVVTRVDEAGPAAAAGVQPGWVLEQLGDRRLADMLERLDRLEGVEDRIAETRFAFGVNALLTGPAGEAETLRFLDAEDRPVTLELVRRERPGEPVRFGNLPTFFAEFSHERLPAPGVEGDCVGVIRFSVWMLPVSAAFDRAIDDVRSCAGVVIDLRGNPGGVAGMVMGIAGHFFEEFQPLGIIKQRSAELRLVANPRRVSAAGERVEPFGGRVAILTDRASVSTSEIFAAGMQTQERARVFGDTTAGQALPAVAVRLPNGDVLMHVIADLTGPDGRRIEGSGVAPDERVPLTRAGLLAGRDAPLDAALRWITGRPAASTMRVQPARLAGRRISHGPRQRRWRSEP
jgi:carboxyl-terminal processing protease